MRRAVSKGSRQDASPPRENASGDYLFAIAIQLSINVKSPKRIREVNPCRGVSQGYIRARARNKVNSENTLRSKGKDRKTNRLPGVYLV
jgi:hypothetical protein